MGHLLSKWLWKQNMRFFSCTKLFFYWNKVETLISSKSIFCIRINVNVHAWVLAFRRQKSRGQYWHLPLSFTIIVERGIFMKLEVLVWDLASKSESSETMSVSLYIIPLSVLGLEMCAASPGFYEKLLRIWALVSCLCNKEFTPLALSIAPR